MVPGDKGIQDLNFGGPAIYRIVVQGPLSEEWSGRLAGMEITETSSGEGMPRTELHGPIRDQLELIGVLETLHDLHMPIVRVEQVDELECESK